MSKHTRDVPFALAQVIDEWHPERIVACVNAMNGIEDPQAALRYAAAAPEMLEALRGAEEAIGVAIDNAFHAEDRYHLRKIQRKVESAIAKAEGE